MTKYLEMTGATEEEAIAKALAQLGLDRDDVSVEVLERPKKGFLGIGSVPAKVKLTYEGADEPAPVKEAEPVRTQAAPVSAPAPAEEKRPEPAREQPAAAAPVPAGTLAAERQEKAEAFLTGLLEHMGVTARPQFSLEEDGSLKVDLMGEGLGALIGRRGETLDAIQQLTNYAVNHGQSKRVRIHIDAENYRAKREESLQRLAHKMAGKVVKYRRSMTLEPMNAYERHVIHTALQDYRDVTTYSTGTEPNRRVVVAYSRGE